MGHVGSAFPLAKARIFQAVLEIVLEVHKGFIFIRKQPEHVSGRSDARETDNKRLIAGSYLGKYVLGFSDAVLIKVSQEVQGNMKILFLYPFDPIDVTARQA